MANVNPNFVYRVSVVGEALGQAVVNVQTFRFLVNPNATADSIRPDHALAAFALQWRVQVMPHVNIAYKVSHYRIVEITGRTPDPIVGGVPAEEQLAQQAYVLGGVDDQGDSQGDPLPTLNAVTVAMATGLAGKGQTGGMRLGLLDEDFVTANDIQEAKRASIETSLQWIKGFTVGAPPNDAFMYRCIYQRTKFLTSPGTVGAPGSFAPAVTVVKVRTRIGSQVSRKPAVLSR